MKSKTIIIAALAALGAIACLFMGVRTVAAGLVHPVENCYRKVSGLLSTRVGGFFAAGAAAARNKELEREISRLRLVRVDNDNLRAENERLRVMAGFDPPGGRARWIPATVLSRDGATGVRRFMRIDRGTRSGVVKGAAVATAEGLVGRVAEVGPNEAMVLPITDPAVRVACEVKTDDPAAGPIYGILYGNGERSRAAEKALFVYAVNPLRLGHMAKAANFTIPRNARIVTSGLGGVFPRGLAVGHLLDGTSDDDSRLERQGVVAPAVDFTSLEYVFIRRED